jgi:hypothetical protein
MGSVVGGLYAAGLSPAEVDQTIQSVDWVRVFQDKLDRQELSFRRKQDDRNFLTNLRLGFKDWSVFIPSGVVEGQKLDFLLRSMTLDQNGLAQIENLPLPFRAVATDIATGEEFVFDKGPLAVAQRASMSVPAFTPVVIDKRVPGGRLCAATSRSTSRRSRRRKRSPWLSTPVGSSRAPGAVRSAHRSGPFPYSGSGARQIEAEGDRRAAPAGSRRRGGGVVHTDGGSRRDRARSRARRQDKLARYGLQAEYAQWRAPAPGRCRCVSTRSGSRTARPCRTSW